MVFIRFSFTCIFTTLEPAFTRCVFISLEHLKPDMYAFYQINTRSRLNKIASAVLVLGALMLSACQPAYVKLDPPSQTSLVLSKEEADAILSEYRKKSYRLREGEGNVAIYCTGMYDCQLASIDDSLIVNDKSGLPFRSAVQKNVVSLVKDARGDTKAIGIAQNGRHDVSVRIYTTPATNYEQFALVHTFEPDSVYRIHAYRKIDNAQSDMSLLALATPKPLCVKVYKNQTPIRQFCKVSDIVTGLGEFEETKVDKQYNDAKGFIQGLISKAK